MQDMIAYLAGCGISAERKSLYDDLELLRVYGMDVQSVKGKSFGYFLGERDFQLPELKLLIDVVQASPFLTQSKSMALIGKLERLTSRPNARQLRRQVYVMDRVKTHNERLYYAIDGLNTAINDGKKVTFRYFDWTAAGARPTAGTARCTRRTPWRCAWTGTTIWWPTIRPSATTATTGWIGWRV